MSRFLFLSLAQSIIVENMIVFQPPHFESLLREQAQVAFMYDSSHDG